MHARIATAFIVLVLAPSATFAQQASSGLASDHGVDIETLRRSGYEGPVPLDGRTLLIDPLTGQPTLGGAADKTVSDAPWDPGFQVPGPSNGVNAVCVFQGGLFVGGVFETLGSVAASHLAYYDGTRWWSSEERFGFSLGYVEDMVVHDAKLVISGDVSYVGPTATSRYIVGFDGTSLSGYGKGFSGKPRALLDLGGTLVAGGSFFYNGDNSVVLHGLARWSGTNWVPYGDGQNGTVYALCDFGGDLVIGGSFSAADGVTVAGIARWTGATFATISGVPVSGTGGVRSLLVHDGDLYAGGSFASIEGVAADNLARWDGTTWSEVGHGISRGTYDQVACLREVGSDVLVAGRFTRAGNLNTTGCVLWNGKRFVAMAGGVGSADEIVLDAAEWDGGLWLAGNFFTAGAGTAYRLAVWDGSGWSPAPGVEGNGLNGMVSTLCLWNGDLIAGGQFTVAGNTLTARIARWDGTSWHALGDGMDDRVSSLTVWNGDLIAAGRFQQAGGSSCRRIARWDGTQWLDLGGGLAQEPEAMLSWQGHLYVGGGLSEAGGVNVANLTVWDGAAWSTPAGGVDGAVRALLDDGDRLIVGGDFTHAGNAAVAADHLAAWDGAGWSEFGAGADGSVYALAQYDGIVAGGEFLDLGGVPCSRIGRWDGSAWHPLGEGFVPWVEYDCGPDMTCRADLWVTDLAVSEGRLYAGGITQTGGLPVNSVACWTDLDHWTPLGSGVAGVAALCRDTERLWVGGDFGPMTGSPGSNLACWRLDRVPAGGDERWWGGFDLLGVDNRITTLGRFDGKLVAAGWFDHAGALAASGAAAWDGTSWTVLGDGFGPFGLNQPDITVLREWNGDLYAGGMFTLPPSTDYVSVARWDGTQWEPVMEGIIGQYVYDLVPYGNDLMVIGTFDAANGVPANGLARYDGTGFTVIPVTLTADSWGCYMAGGAVYQGDLVVYGSFQTLNGEPCGNLARWDGTAWLPPGDDFAVTGRVNDALVQGDRIYVGGAITEAFGASAAGIVCWDGTAWSDVGGGVARASGYTPEVRALADLSGTVVAAGYFDMAGGEAGFAELAAWDGQAWSPLGAGFTLATPTLGSLAVYGSDLYVAGGFDVVGDKNSHDIGRWLGPTSSEVPAPVAPTRLELRGAFPNPFNGCVNIRYEVPRETEVALAVFDLRGRLVRTLVSGMVPSGPAVAPWDGRDDRGRPVPSGVYFVRLSGDGASVNGKIMYVR